MKNTAKKIINNWIDKQEDDETVFVTLGLIGICIKDHELSEHKDCGKISCSKCWKENLKEVHKKEFIKANLKETINMQSGKFETVKYMPSCKYGYTDCILDPNYIKATYPKSYEKSGCSIDCGDNCKDGDSYDNEDK